MPEIIQIALLVILIIILAFVGFAIVEKVELPKPGNLIARCVVGGIALYWLYQVVQRLF